MMSHWHLNHQIHIGFGPERAGIQRERLIRTVTLKMRANRPRSIKIDKLTENTTYRIILTGISPDDAIKRTGSFRTFAKCEGDGAGLLLETKGYSKRYHLGSYDDSLTYGGIGIGDEKFSKVLLLLPFPVMHK